MKKMLVLVVYLMLFSCSSDSINESNAKADNSSVNTILVTDVGQARLDFEKNYRMYMFDKEGMTQDNFVSELYVYAYEFLKALGVSIPSDKEEVIGMAIALYHDANSVVSPGKEGIARSIEIINNTPYDLNLDIIIVKLNYSGLGSNYLFTPELIKVAPYQSFA